MPEHSLDNIFFTHTFNMYMMQANAAPTTYVLFQQPPPLPLSLPHPITQYNCPQSQQWVFWLYYRTAPTSAGVLVKIATVESFEQLIEAQNSLDDQKLRDCVSVNFFVFKAGFQPDKKNAGNQNGGCWSATMIESFLRNSREIVKSWWTTLVQAIVLEEIHPDPEVCEAIVGVRLCLKKRNEAEAPHYKKCDRIELWTENADRPSIQYKLGMSMKILLHLHMEITYIQHKDIIKHSKQKWQYQQYNLHQPDQYNTIQQYYNNYDVELYDGDDDDQNFDDRNQIVEFQVGESSSNTQNLLRRHRRQYRQKYQANSCSPNDRFYQQNQINNNNNNNNIYTTYQNYHDENQYTERCQYDDNTFYNNDQNRIVTFQVAAPANSQSQFKQAKIYERQTVNSSSTYKNTNDLSGSQQEGVVEIRLNNNYNSNQVQYYNRYNTNMQQYNNNNNNQVQYYKRQNIYIQQQQNNNNVQNRNTYYSRRQNRDNRIITVYLNNNVHRGFFSGANVTRRGRFFVGGRKNKFLYEIN